MNEKEIMARTVADCLRETYYFASKLDWEEFGKDVEKGYSGDITTIADKLIEETVIKYLERTLLINHISAKLISEEMGEKQIGSSSPAFLIVVDPLDGTVNFKRGRKLPYTTTIAIFDMAHELTFDKVIAAGTIDLRNMDLWVAKKGEGCTLTNKEKNNIFINKTCKVSQEITLTKNSIILGDFYYEKNREILAKIFADWQGWLRDTGSAAYEMALLAEGVVDAFISFSQKNHELAAAYLLIKEAGGVIMDFEGNDISEYSYDFNAKTSIVAAATHELAEEILKRINRNLKLSYEDSNR